MQYLALAARCLLGLVFLASVSTKVTGPAAYGAFVRSVRRMRLFPPALVAPVAAVVVVAEAAIVVLVAVPTVATALAGFAVAAGLLLAFAGGIALTVRRGTSTTCRCFGASTVPLGPAHVVRNLLLVAVAVVGGAAVLSGGSLRLGESLVAAVAGLVVGGLVTVMDDIRGLFRPTPASRGR
ncbi:MauE/DoxX family redox-associated membrane protein [Longispora sp. NPDC051575]|uniref:MauE/DoxX family redox-associated membrane protein n=1 Tax=Longispora sp. NPDC051575 TaxID=3154943 RepID=UPI003447AEBA